MLLASGADRAVMMALTVDIINGLWSDVACYKYAVARWNFLAILS